MTGIISGYGPNVQNNLLVKSLLEQLANARQTQAVMPDPQTNKTNDVAPKNAKAADGEDTKTQASGCACGLSRNGCSKKCKMIKAYNKH